MPKRPHVIIINPDEMRSSALGHLGNQAGATPNLDQFAATDAVSFENAYCQNPVCVPSRCAAFTGLYPHVRGHRTMNYLLHADEPSMFSELRDAGYHVWMNCRNDLVAGQIDGLMDRHADKVFYYERPPLTPEQLRAMQQFGKQANPYPYSHFTGVTPGDVSGDMIDTAAAAEYIRGYGSDKPLCLFLGWTNPHPPYAVAQKYYDRIDASKIKPRLKAEDCSGKSSMVRLLAEANGMADCPETFWADMQRVYLGQCAFVDDMFKMVCDALKEKGMYDDSLIVFWSDHGDYCGDYGLAEKAQNTFEDCLVKVPFLIKPPKGMPADAGVTGSIAEMIDLYATVMDYTGVVPSHSHFGQSVRCAVEDRSVPLRSYAFCEGGRGAGESHCTEFSENDADSVMNAYFARLKLQTDSAAHEKGTMITDTAYKYVRRALRDDEFYDLTADPDECTNLYPSRMTPAQQQRLAQLQDAMLTWYQQTCDTVPMVQDNRFTPERVWAVVGPMTPAPLREAAKEYIYREHPDIRTAMQNLRNLKPKAAE